MRGQSPLGTMLFFGGSKPTPYGIGRFERQRADIPLISQLRCQLPPRGEASWVSASLSASALLALPLGELSPKVTERAKKDTVHVRFHKSSSAANPLRPVCALGTSPIGRGKKAVADLIVSATTTHHPAWLSLWESWQKILDFLTERATPVPYKFRR